MNRLRGLGVSITMRPVFLLILMVLVLLAACDAADQREQGTILVVAMAGPTCPVETDPPDPDCAPRAVPDATILVTVDGGDSVVAQGETDANGQLRLDVAPGDYTVTAGAVEGLMAAPQPVMVSVLAGVTTEVPLGYDTGIR